MVPIRRRGDLFLYRRVRVVQVFGLARGESSFFEHGNRTRAGNDASPYLEGDLGSGRVEVFVWVNGREQHVEGVKVNLICGRRSLGDVRWFFRFPAVRIVANEVVKQTGGGRFNIVIYYHR